MNARVTRTFVGMAATLLLSALVSHAEEVKPVLYVGTDVALQQGSSFIPVSNVTGGFMEIRAGKEKRKFSSFNLPGLRFEQKMKVSALDAKVDEIKIERAYTPENDPNKRFMENAHTQSALQNMGSMQRDSAYRERQDHVGSFARAMNNPAPGVDPATMEREMLQREANAVRAADVMMNSDFNTMQQRANMDINAEMFDAIDVRFEISCEIPVANPYLILIAQYKHPGDDPKKIRTWVYGYDMDAIGPKPTTVRFKQGGFEPGFELVKTSVHFYSQGREIPTNLSDKRVSMSLEDASRFTLAQHLATNKGSDLSPAPVITPIPSDFRKRLNDDDLNRVIAVTVGEDGRVKSVRDPKTNGQEVAPALVSVVNGFIFNPGLEKGKPVEKSTTIRLADFL